MGFPLSSSEKFHLHLGEERRKYLGIYFLHGEDTWSPQARTARCSLDREKLAIFHEGNQNVIPVKSPFMSPPFLINILYNLILNKQRC